MSTMPVVGPLLAASLVCAAGTAVAQDRPPASAASAFEAPKPPPEFVEYMKDLVGSWTCATTFPPGALGPGSPEVKTTSKLKISKDPALGGFFYRGEYKVPKSKDVPVAFSGVVYLGYEPASKQITSVSVDNSGAISMAVGPLTGNTGNWLGDGYMMGKKVKTRETMVKDGPKQLTHKFELDAGHGFELMGHDVCKK